MTDLPAFSDIEWRISAGLTPYDQSLAEMEARAAAVAAGEARELVWLLENPPVYTGVAHAHPGAVGHSRLSVDQTGRRAANEDHVACSQPQS